MQISESTVKGKCCHNLTKELKLRPFWSQSVCQLQVCATAATAICFLILCMNEFMCWTICVSWTKHSSTGVDSWNSHNSRIEDGNCRSWYLFLWDRKCTGQDNLWWLKKNLKMCGCGYIFMTCYSSTQRTVRKLHLSPYIIRAVQELKGPDSVLHIVSVYAWGKWNKHVQFGFKGLRWCQSLAKFGKCFFFVGYLTANYTMQHWKVEWFMNDECESIWKKATMACTKCY